MVHQPASFRWQQPASSSATKSSIKVAPSDGPTRRLRSQKTPDEPERRLRSRKTPEMSIRSARSRQGTAEASLDWLPYARESPLAAREAHARFAQSQKHRDWFMALVCAMEDLPENNGQSKMLFKMYVFMRDFFPQGLAGGLGHVRGSGVMGQLLCHNSSTASKHRVTKAAHAAFEELEKWMAGFEDWRAALAAAKDSHHHQSQKRAGSSRSAPPKDAWKTPGLHSAEGLMAVLVISHPDDKFRAWVGRLQIQWMMLQDPETLAVRDGFWKGLTHKDLHLVFNEPEDRQPQTQLLADYDALFGQDFRRYRKDIRPLIPSWAAGLLQVGPADQSDVEAEDTLTGPRVSGMVPDDLVRAVRAHLTRPAVVGPEQLEAWLADILAAGGDDVLLAWCKHWTARSEKVMSYMEQKIVRELFLQSIRRAFSIAHSIQTRAYVIAGETTLATAYLLADIADGKLHSFNKAAEYAEVREQLGKFPEYTALTREYDKLARAATEHMASDVATSLIARVSESLTYSLIELVKGPGFFTHWRGVFLYQVARTRAILDNLDVPEAASHITRWWRSRRDQLLMDETLEPARLTNWQICAMLWPGADCSEILTHGQDHLFRNIDYSSRIKRELRISPVSVPRPAPPGALSPAAARKREEHATLFSFFTEIPTSEKPPPPAPSRSGPELQENRSEKPPPPALSRSGPELQENRRDTTAESQRALERSTSRDTAASERGNTTTAPTTSLNSSSVATSPQTAFSKMTVTPTASRAGQPAGCSPSTRTVFSSSHGSAIPNNPFAGCIGPRKRKASPDTEDSVARMPVKSLRTILDAGRDLQGEEIRRWLKADREALEGGLQSVRSDLERLRETVNNKCAHEKLRTSLNFDLDQIKAGMAQNHAALTNSLQGTFDASLKTHTHQLRTELTTDLTSLINSTLASHLEEVKAATRPITPPPPITPVLGSEGYLRLYCPAPPGWQQDVYEGQLERAVWSYIAHVGDIDSSDYVGPHEGGMDHIGSMFPGLKVEDIVTALNHVHMRVFRRPFGWPEDEQEATEDLFNSVETES